MAPETGGTTSPNVTPDAGSTGPTGGQSNDIVVTAGTNAAGAGGHDTRGPAASGNAGEAGVAGSAGGPLAGGGAFGVAGEAGAGGVAGSMARGGRAGALASMTRAGAGGAGGAGGATEFVPSGGAGPGCPEHGACSGYTLFGVPPNSSDYNFPSMLLDMDGQMVHTWSTAGFPPKMLPGGSVVGCSGVFPTAYDCVELRQETWSGDIEWSFSDWSVSLTASPAARQHHDWQREGNPVGYYAPGQPAASTGKTLVLAHEFREEPSIHQGVLMDDVIYEVDASGTPTGFEWRGLDHFSQFGFDADAQEDILTRDSGSQPLDWLHGNSMSRVGPNRWYDSGHAEFHPDNIIYSSRDSNFVIIIDHETGDVVWRIGPDFAGRPEEALGQFVGQHHPHMIPRGLPGEGNILVFDNGGDSGYGVTTEPSPPFRYSRSYSRVVEFDPTTFEIVWEYGSPSGADYFFSYFVSSVQRLPNGNTLIAIGNDGRIIEVTPDHEVVWEYSFEPDTTSTVRTWIYRAYRVPPEWLPSGQNERLGNYVSWGEQYPQ